MKHEDQNRIVHLYHFLSRTTFADPRDLTVRSVCVLCHTYVPQVRNSAELSAVHDVESDEQGRESELQPQWELLSFQGLLGVLTLAVSVFTKVILSLLIHLPPA